MHLREILLGCCTSAADVAHHPKAADQILRSAKTNGLPAPPTAAQMMAAAFPLNYNGQQLDIFQIVYGDTGTRPVTNILGGASPTWIYRLSYAGVGSTT